ncbi:zinc finger MYM-type protein 1-like isoform X1 [Schistocerca serialis cubense]|uniref:zinc finger MYM-type protein 1-like isoform X1 n=1 Tax=Schistocerca serialis cubense TaxID=2023355 RepID=UPI00214E096C|nr:zinc finger MYM-type protein 1-like isoform X1 [Schistocerca serialis cubense]
MNSVESILRANRKLNYQDKLAAKELGPPRPDLLIENVTKSVKRDYKRTFNKELYDKHKWLCGCNLRQALYCFPCLIFSPEVNSWTNKGVRDLVHLSEKIKKREKSHVHKNANIELSVLGKVNISTQLDSVYRESVRKHNEQVDRNRHILSRLIDCIKFCGAFELALRGHDEREDPENPGVFRGLVNLVSAIDGSMKEHLETATVFKGTSRTVQNELLDCMLSVCREIITQEILNAHYLAIMADETTDVSTMQQLVIVYRYELNGSVVERFWGFFNPDTQDAETLFKVIKSELQKHADGKKEKVIAQCYDGAAVMSGGINGVQARIKQMYPRAYYIHCYAHQLNPVLQKAASVNKSARIFFSNLSGFPAFFSRSSHGTCVLDRVVQTSLPRIAATRLVFNIQTVNTIRENKESMIECLGEITLSDRVDDKTRRESYGLLSNLKNPEFLFWLEFFHRIMPHADILFRKLQQQNVEAITARQYLLEFEDVITRIRNTAIEEISFATEEISSSCEEQIQKKRKSETKVENAKEVCDAIISHMNERFSFTDHLVASKLLDVSSFSLFSTNFPERELDITVEMYPWLSKVQLRTELEVLYSRKDFQRAGGAVAILQLLLDNKLDLDTFPQLCELMRIIITTPLTTVEPERCFSTMKRIKTFLRNTVTENRLSALAMLTIEKKFVNHTKDFNHRVIETFARLENRRMDFLYK